MTKTITTLITMAFLTALLSAPAFAGWTRNAQVTVGSTYAYGSLEDARRSTDGNQYIGCTLSTQYTPSHVSCYASDRNGRVRSCYTSNPSPVLASMVAGLSADSFVYFSSASGQCRIRLQNESVFIR